MDKERNRVFGKKLGFATTTFGRAMKGVYLRREIGDSMIADRFDEGSLSRSLFARLIADPKNQVYVALLPFVCYTYVRSSILPSVNSVRPFRLEPQKGMSL